ncbi:MAG: head GIN domain-containing protein [Psychroflexus halocasei]
MKAYFLYICLFVASIVSAQDRTEIIEENFNKIKIANKVDVDLVPYASENKIEISGYDADEVIIKVKQGELVVKLPIDEVFSDSDTKIKLYIKDFTSLNLNNGADVEITSQIKQKEISLEASEGSFLSADLDVKTARLKAVSGAEMHLYGEAENQYITVKTGGIYIGKSFEVENTDVKVSYGGTAEVFASQSCKAKTTAGGTIEIYGNPRSVDQKTKLGGTIDVISK